MNCTECNGPLPREFRQGKRIRSHVTCPPASLRTWPTAHQPSDLEALRLSWQRLQPKQRGQVRIILSQDEIWCHCPENDQEPEYYDDESGHGWTCGTCGKLIQVG